MNKRAAACFVAVAILGIVSVLALRENHDIDDYQGEIAAITEALKSKNSAEVDKILGRQVSQGRYGKIEEATKNYVKDLLKVTDEMRELRDSDDLYTLLDGKNLKEDDEELSASKRKAEKLRQEADKIIEEYNAINDNAASIYLKGHDEEAQGLFNTAIDDIIESDYDAKNYVSTKALVSSTIDTYSEALDYLAKHRNAWTVKNNSLDFTSSSAQKEYQKILDKAADAHNKELSSAQ